MKIRNQFIPVVVVLFLFLNACKKDKTAPIYPDYGMLKAGNYWIYQRFIVDSNDNGIATNEYDSCYIEKDTVINGLTYAKSMRPNAYSSNPVPTFLRDSLHYIVTNSGAIVFSSQDFSSVFSHEVYINPPSDTTYEITVKMDHKDMPFAAPAGNFTTSDYQTHYHMYVMSPITNRYLHVRYAENVGIVSETMLFYSSSFTYNELRLVRYHVK
ncbi:MAG TPA: hypothetical protein VK154_16365 [Chitinophagales bacterium]|nr:hypothetical protein [Chitinophagales bacterium]